MAPRLPCCALSTRSAALEQLRRQSSGTTLCCTVKLLVLPTVTVAVAVDVADGVPFAVAVAVGVADGQARRSKHHVGPR